MQTTPGTSLTDGTPAPPVSNSHPRLRLWVAVAAVAYVLDQATKAWAEHALADGEPRSVLGDLLSFHLTHNPGAAFSMGTGYTVALTLIAIAVIVVCVKMARRLGSTGWAIGLGLLLGGALGNVTDRLFRDPSPFRGHVVDWIEVPHWPVFNLADTAICVAAGIFVLQSLRGVHLDGRREGLHADEAGGTDRAEAARAIPDPAEERPDDASSGTP
jgi:signal peptidase II